MNVKFRSIGVVWKKADFKTTAVLWGPYKHAYGYTYKNPTGMMKNCMAKRVGINYD